MELEKMNWRTLFSAKPGLSSEDEAILDNYFSRFVAVPIVKGADGKDETQPQSCPGCERKVTGLFGTFMWGIAHGVGMCSACSWPAVAHHYIKDESGREVATITNVILIVHPDFVSRRKG